MAEVETEMKSLADPSVLEVLSSMGGKQSYRAIVGHHKDAYYLVIETLSVGNGDGDPASVVKSLHIQDFTGGSKIQLSGGWYISDLAWRSDGLKFKNSKASGSLISSKKCTLKLFQSTPSVACE